MDLLGLHVWIGPWNLKASIDRDDQEPEPRIFGRPDPIDSPDLEDCIDDVVDGLGFR